MQTKFLILFLFASICISFIFPIKNVNGEENVKEIDISTSPHKVFFEILNAKPGDIFTKTLKVQNDGKKDFKFLFSNQFLTGSKKIYNELILNVTNKSGELYNGKLKDYKKLESRSLKSKTDEDLTFSIYFPYELGNEFQNLSCEFQFKFYVEGTLGGTLPVDGPKLPDTGTNMFNTLLAGAFLIVSGSILQYFIKKRRKLQNDV